MIRHCHAAADDRLLSPFSLRHWPFQLPFDQDIFAITLSLLSSLIRLPPVFRRHFAGLRH